MASVSTCGLTRRFGTITAVDKLTVELPDQGVIGLVGPNGSGKSTLIRMLLGLVRPSGGEALVLGSSIHHPKTYAAQVGALIESPAFIPALSARANLQSLARLRTVPSFRIDQVLAAVGLLGRDREPTRGFSLGMKQRLGIATALLPDPRLLILDEPTNGLDPAGVVEIRELLRTLAQQGKAVLVSSHLLQEIETACDYLVIIRSGQLLWSGPISDLLAQAEATIETTAEYPADHDRLKAALIQSGWDANTDEGFVRVRASTADGAAINRAASQAGITLSSLVLRNPSLEEMFLKMTNPPDEAPSDASVQLGAEAPL